MNFTSLELSKKLVVLGCKSCVEREKYYFIHSEELDSEGEQKFEAYPKFTLEDFVGTHEQAKENTRLLFEDPWSTKRYEMIDSDDWRDYLEKAVEGRCGI